MKEFLQSPLGNIVIVAITVVVTLMLTDVYDGYTKTDSGKTLEQEVSEIKETVNENKIHLQYIKEAVRALSEE